MTIEILIAILAGDGILAGTISSVITWLLTRKKYNSEVDQSNIQNMQESLDFYIKISDDYKQRLASEIESHNKEVAELKAENSELRKELAEYKRELREQEKKFDTLYTNQQKEISLIKNQMLSVYSQVCMNFKCGARIPTEDLPIIPIPKVRKVKTTKKENKDGEKI